MSVTAVPEPIVVVKLKPEAEATGQLTAFNQRITNAGAGAFSGPVHYIVDVRETRLELAEVVLALAKLQNQRQHAVPWSYRLHFVAIDQARLIEFGIRATDDPMFDDIQVFPTVEMALEHVNACVIAC